jgi:hypothetical protein
MKNLIVVVASTLALVLLFYLSLIALGSSGFSNSNGYSSIILTEASQSWAGFTIENHGGKDTNYGYEVYTTRLSKESLEYVGEVAVLNDNKAIIYYALAPMTERVRIRLSSGQEVSFYTGYKFTEWRPEIVSDLRWDEQDPLVKEFYKRTTEVSKTYERRT